MTISYLFPDEDFTKRIDDVSNQGRWKKVCEDIEISQQMVENLVKDTLKMNKEEFNQVIEKEKLITQEKKQDESLSIANEIAEVIKEEYQQSFNKIKDKLMSSLKEKSDHKLGSSVMNEKQPLKEQKVSKNSGHVKEVMSTKDRNDIEDKGRSRSAYNSRSSKRKNQNDKENVNRDSEVERVHSIEKANKGDNNTEEKDNIKKVNENILDKEALKLFQAFKGYLKEGTKENSKIKTVNLFQSIFKSQKEPQIHDNHSTLFTASSGRKVIRHNLLRDHKTSFTKNFQKVKQTSSTHNLQKQGLFSTRGISS